MSRTPLRNELHGGQHRKLFRAEHIGRFRPGGPRPVSSGLAQQEVLSGQMLATNRANSRRQLSKNKKHMLTRNPGEIPCSYVQPLTFSPMSRGKASQYPFFRIPMTQAVKQFRFLRFQPIRINLKQCWKDAFPKP